jgi:hypothetical protein
MGMEALSHRPRKAILADLHAHWLAGGTSNSYEVDELFIEYHRLPPETHTELETVEQWANDHLPVSAV